jgi:alkylation response protein AidB-like acyl-CoA dehydrogenase
VDLTQEQRELRDAVRGLLGRAERKPDDGGGCDRALWQRLCQEIGVAGLAIPERFGGAGAGPAETHVVMAELGSTLAPVPMLGSAVLAAQALLATGDDAACERLLPGIAGGTTVAALAWTPESGGWDPGEAAFAATPPAGSARPAAATPPAGSGTTAHQGDAAGCGTRAAAGGGSGGEGWALDGVAHYVLDGDLADVLLAAAATPDGTALFEVDLAGSGVSRAAATTMDTTRRLAVVRLGGASGRLIGAAGSGDGSGVSALARARDLACIALSGEQVGAAGRALELTVAYTRDRVQFGRPIGSFQALQHRMADLHILVESARSLSYAAAAAAAGDAPDLAVQAAAVKAHCSEMLLTVAAEMIQLHGAIAITWEHEAHRYFKRAHGAAHLFGHASTHLARVATEIVDGPAVLDGT